MHLSIEGRKQDGGRLHRGDKFKGNTEFIICLSQLESYLPCLVTEVGFKHKHSTLNATELFFIHA